MPANLKKLLRPERAKVTVGPIPRTVALDALMPILDEHREGLTDEEYADLVTTAKTMPGFVVSAWFLRRAQCGCLVGNYFAGQIAKKDESAEFLDLFSEDDGMALNDDPSSYNFEDLGEKFGVDLSGYTKKAPGQDVLHPDEAMFTYDVFSDIGGMADGAMIRAFQSWDGTGQHLSYGDVILIDPEVTS